MKPRGGSISGDNGNGTDGGEGWLLMLMLETLKEENERLRTGHCQPQTLCKLEDLGGSSSDSPLRTLGRLSEIRPTL